MADNLKPCPFCGEPAWKTYDHAHSTGFWINCQHKEPCQIDEAWWGKTEDEAVTAWNTRAKPKVMQLYWSGDFGHTGLGHYYHIGKENVLKRHETSNETGIGVFETRDEAKAAAQADYERRVLECLEGE